MCEEKSVDNVRQDAIEKMMDIDVDQLREQQGPRELTCTEEEAERIRKVMLRLPPEEETEEEKKDREKRRMQDLGKVFDNQLKHMTKSWFDEN